MKNDFDDFFSDDTNIDRSTNAENSNKAINYDEEYKRQLEEFQNLSQNGGNQKRANGNSSSANNTGRTYYGERPRQNADGYYNEYGEFVPYTKEDYGQMQGQQGRTVKRDQIQNNFGKNTRKSAEKKVRNPEFFAEQKRVTPAKSKKINENFGKQQPANTKKKQSGKNKGKRKNKMDKKKKSPVKTIFIIILIILLVLVILSQLLIFRYIRMVNKVDTGTRQYTSASMKSDDVTNILLIGSDTRDEEENGRTDTIILLSIDSEKKKITMTSFMRDTYVEFPNYDGDADGINDWGKINAANVYGGPELLMDTIEYNFDIAVDKYIFVDFFSFIDIVDAVGGIELTISDEEVQGMIAPMSEQNRILENEKGTDYLTSGGTDILCNGNQALAYARLRYVGNADFERTERQRTVVTKILEKAKELSIFDLDNFAKTCLSSITTNMTQSELYFFTYKVPFIMNYEIVQQRIPDDDGYTYGTHGGESTLDVDMDRAKKLLQDSIYS